ncbi:uncharacterized protein N7473_006138 [Penicillium subrubescens]|uniref:uncharacterized protein n=1 Tax=Penicillium subrubescens TaxID=1316194 RepID=UPI002544FA14|nr:uncharacterized protein N7473_006138 [Penicillium subrubescens]KAJ5896739.1 hypothetical protein N7473_006138 [Penicillium subrubescens]
MKAKTAEDALRPKKPSRKEKFTEENVDLESRDHQRKALREEETGMKTETLKEKTTKDASRPKTRSRDERTANKSVQSRSEGDQETTASSEARREKKKRHE